MTTKEKPVTYHLDNDIIKGNCLREIAMLPVGANKLVVIKDKKQTRSEVQHRLKWVWMGFLAKEREGNEGWDRKDWNRFFKGKYMRGLLLEQDEEFHEFFTQADRMLENAPDEEAKAWAKRTFIDAMKTEWLTVKNMSEFMTLIDRYCLDARDEYGNPLIGLKLPVPDDLKWSWKEAA